MWMTVLRDKSDLFDVMVGWEEGHPTHKNDTTSMEDLDLSGTGLSRFTWKMANQ